MYANLYVNPNMCIMKKQMFLVLACVASVLACMATPPELTYNGEVLPWNTDWQRSMCGELDVDQNIIEVSGIACSRVTPGYLWMQSDEIQNKIIAGDEAGVAKTMTVNLTGDDLRWDWEDLSGGVYNGKDYLFIGAFGDNDETDGEFRIVYFEEPAITAGSVTIDPGVIKYKYPDGIKHNTEALMYDNKTQTIYIITKKYYQVCKVYKIPFRTDYGGTEQTLAYVCDLGVQADLGDGSKPDKGFHLVTAADISPDGKYVLIKNQNNTSPDYSWILLWERQGEESIDQTLKRQPQPLKCYDVEWQGEAICWLDDYTFYTTSDADAHQKPPIYKYTRKQPLEKKEITIDGNMDDWADVTGIAHAEDDAATNKLHGLRIYAEGNDLFFYVEFDAAVSSLSFFMSTDENPSTGYAAWMWNTTTEYMIEGASISDLSEGILYQHNSATQDAWTWKEISASGLLTGAPAVTLTNGHKALEGKLDMSKMPALPLTFAVYANAGGEHFIPKMYDPMLDVEIYVEQATGIEEVQSQESGMRKVLVDGVIYIIRDGKVFNAQGAQLK